MAAKDTYKKLESLIDSLMAGNKVSLDELSKSLKQVSCCILENYENSRELLQRTIGLLERCPKEAISVLLSEIISFIDTIDTYFSPDVKNVSDIYQMYSLSWSDDSIKSIYQKVMPLFEKEYNISQCNEQLAIALSQDERKQFVNFAIDCIQRYGLQTTWKKEIIQMHYDHFSILYSICKHDSIMPLLFQFANNFIDRLPSSTNPQLARDLVESILIIGYNEKMEADAYLSAARAYTLCHNAIAGLFYLLIAYISIDSNSRELSKDEAYDILWLLVKTMRELPGYFEKMVNLIIEKFNNLHCDDYQVLSFMHSVFLYKLKGQQESVVSEVLDFLNEYRETIMQNLEHSTIPWVTLLSEMENFYPTRFYDQLKMYKNIFIDNIEKSGNERLIDILKGNNLAQRLFESIKQLEETRNSSDYASDNKSAVLIANSLLPQAVERANVGDFILSMRVKTDFTFIFKDTYQNEMYRRIELEDEQGEYETPYRHINTLPSVLAIDEEDCMVWIGQSNGLYYYMSLKGKEYDLRPLESWNGLNVNKMNKIVSQLQYILDSTDKSGYYPKSAQDFEVEDKNFREQYGQHILPLENIPQRLLMVKDVQISSMPHHLLCLPSGELIGVSLPSANVVSTEYLIQSNFYNNVDSDIRPNMWIPLESEDMTLLQLWSHLESDMKKIGAEIFESLAIEKPMNRAINIVCAHGARTINETEWFYANDQPVKNVDDIVGEGQLLVLLVCHAGTMQAGNYDTAVHSIIKKFIKKGYCSIVAPAWSLSTEFVPLWLSTFMDEFVNKKEYVIDAVFKANMAVKDAYTAISAWACMHLYGNPYLQVNEKPRLSLVENAVS